MWLLRSKCTTRSGLAVLNSSRIDRANQQILDQISSQHEVIKEFKEEVENKFARIVQLLLKSNSHSEMTSLVTDEAETGPSPKQLESASNKSSARPQTIPAAIPSSGVRDQKVFDSSPNGSFNTVVTESSGGDAPASIARQNQIHSEHFNTAHKLFRWPSIKALLQRCKGLTFNESSENYFMMQEMAQGRMRLYGRGRHKVPLDDQPSNPGVGSPATSQTSIPSEDLSEASSPASWENLWGHGFNPAIGESKPESLNGGLNSDNSLKLDPKTMSNNLQSYLDNIHLMHPILNEHELVKTVEKFKRRYNPSPEQMTAATFLPPTNGNFDATRDGSVGVNRAGKRKHSDGQYHGSANETTLANCSPRLGPLLERSPTTAIVLLVMALGKICECKRPLPGPVMENPEKPKEQNVSMAHGYRESPPPNPMKQSPSSASYTTSASSPLSAARQAHWSSRSVSEAQRNLDVIPGLAYYAQATDILGNLSGSHDISYIQCCLLAGLYAGQLASSFESLHWIQTAARACHNLFRIE